MKTHTRGLMVLGLVLGLSTCRGCRQDEGPAVILDLAGPDAGAVMLVPKIGSLLQGADGFITRATQQAGGDAVRRFRSGFKAQFGFDPLRGEAYAELGIDPDGGAMAFTEGAAREPLLVLTLKDRKAFDKKIRAIIEKSDGANRFVQEKKFGVTIVTAGRPFGDEVVPAFQWAHLGRFVLLARAAGLEPWEAALQRIRGNQDNPEVKRLSGDPVYQRLAKTVAPGLLQLFVRGTGVTELWGAPSGDLSAGVMTSIQLGKQGLDVETFVDVKSPGWEKGFQAKPAGDLWGRVDHDAVIALVTRSAHPKAWEALRSVKSLAPVLDRVATRAQQETGIDAEKEVLPLLAGPLTLSVHLADLSELPKKLKARRGLGTVLEFVHVVVTAEVADPGAFATLLKKSRERLGTRGIAVRQRELMVGGKKATVFEPDQKEPRLGWALWGNHYLYGVGQGRLEKALRVVAQETPALSKALPNSVAADLSGQPTTSVFLFRVGKLADSAGQVMGGARGGLGMDLMFGGLLKVMRALDDVAVGVTPEAGGLRLRIGERLK